MEKCSEVVDQHQHGQEIKKRSPLGPGKSSSSSFLREDISSIWRELHGSGDWVGLVDPLHPCLLQEIIKYGEVAGAAYDAFEDAAGGCRFDRQTFFDQSGLSDIGYEVTRYLYAMSAVELPRWVRHSFHVEKQWKQSNWIGFVAVSNDGETRRIGRRDIVVAWRGTVTKAEWYEDVKVKMKRLCWGENADVAQVEAGFHRIYTSKDASTEYSKTSASEQAMAEIRRLVSAYADRGEKVSLTITGHSLGGALALLNAHEVAAVSIGGLDCVSVLSFGAPSVGNADFKRGLEKLGVKALRVVTRRDLVPQLPGFVGKLEKLAPRKEGKFDYVHAGQELKLATKLGRKHIFRNHSMITHLHQLKNELGNLLR